MVTSPAAIEDPSVPAGTEDPPEVSVEPPTSPVGVPLPAQPTVPAAAPVPVDEEQRQEEERLAKLRQKDERNLRHATLHEEEHYKDFDFSDVVDRKAAMRTTTVESYISFHLGGRPLPRNRVERELLRVEVALQRFHGWGAESEEAFYREMEEEAKEAVADEELARQRSWGIFPAASSTDVPMKPYEVKESLHRLLMVRRIYGPHAGEEGKEALDLLEQMAMEGEVFHPLPIAKKIADGTDVTKKWPEEHRGRYQYAREKFAARYGLPPEAVDDIIRHRLNAQERPVSRDALGQIYLKEDIFYQGLPAIQKAIGDSSLNPLEKRSQLQGLPERFGQFKENIVRGIITDMPEFADYFGIRSVADYDKITTVLNDAAWKQTAGGFLSAADSSVAFIDRGLGVVEGAVTPGDRVPYMVRRSQEVDRRAKVNGQINELSRKFYKEQTTLFGIDAALVGHGIYSTLETAVIVTVTAPLAPQIAVARYGRLAVAFNAAAKVAPAASFIGVKQGFTTYDQAIRTGFPEEEATRLAWFSGLIEGATTIAFSAAGAGGVESIVSGSSREAFRQSVRASVKSAWQEGAKAFGKGVLGEMAEEEFITLLDTALVQTTLNPNMTAEDVRRAFYETAIVSLVTSGPFAAFHGKQVHDDTTADTPLTPEQAGTVGVEVKGEGVFPAEQTTGPMHADSTASATEYHAGILPEATLDSLSKAIAPDLPGINVRDGAKGLLDAPWARDANVMPDLLPLAMEGYGSRFSDEHRISTFRHATDAQLLALGVSPGDLTAIRSALDENPENGIRAINEAFTRLDPNSEIAGDALQEVRTDYHTRYKNGEKPYRLTALPNGTFRVENSKGRILAIAKGVPELIRIKKYLKQLQLSDGQNGPDYSHIRDPKNLLASAKVTPRQAREIRKANSEYNNGVYKDDDTGEELVLSKQSKKDVTPPENEIQIDHIIPIALGGTRSSSNLRVRSRSNNRKKSHKLPDESF